MTLGVGTRLGPYEVQSVLGAGGMGEVYRAHDPRLGRDVAIKILPATLSADADRLRRFEQEARAAAALNHPNILAVHDIGIHGGFSFIVMELLEGETLRDCLGGPLLPVRRVVDFATQIARGLAAAHEKGIIHRDLKPENIFVTADRRVKILDFGLAKLTEDVPSIAGPSQMPTLSPATTPGMVLGTVGYMAPEQVRGEAADHRADVFALGCILYEMLAARRAFHATTTAETMSAIVREDPPDLPLDRVSSGLRRIVQRCLEKQPDARFQTATDLAFAVEAMSGSDGSSESSAQRGPATRLRTRERVAWGLASIFGLVALIFLVDRLVADGANGGSSGPPIARFIVTTPPTDSATSIALSPDGRFLAYVATTEGQSRLWVRPLDDTDARALPGTEGALFPFWSPDAHAIGFFADGKLKRTDVNGGSPQVLADAPNGRGGTWSEQDVILFTPGNLAFQPNAMLMRVSAGGGPVEPVTQFAAGDGAHRWPQFLPDGRRFIFFNTLGRPDRQGTYLASLDGGDPRLLWAAETPAVFTPPDRLMLVQGDTLMEVPFDSEAGTVSGEARPLVRPVGRDEGVVASAFAVSPDVLAYRTGGGTQRRQLVWMDRAGTMMGSVGAADESNLSMPALDPTGRRIAVHRTVLGNFDIWILDANRGIPTRFTFHPAVELLPLWFPDGSRVLFQSHRNGRLGLFAKSATGAGEEQVVIEDGGIPVSWSPDGRLLLYARPDARTGMDLWMVALTGDRKALPVVQAAGDQFGGAVSPDGRWLAYESNESGRLDVYVQSFPEGSGKWQVSNAGGTQPQWRHDGKELYYVASDARLLALSVTPASDGKTLDFGAPEPLFRPRLASGAGSTPGRTQYVVAPDGRFLMNIVVEDTAALPVTVVINWKTLARLRSPS